MACSEDLMTEMNAATKLNPVGSVPTVFYIPEYITLDQEEQLLNNVTSLQIRSLFFSSNFSTLFYLVFIGLQSSSLQVEVFEE